ncbi:MAG: hypothetical protein NTW08_01700 [Gammaproteobacteria bacterium]|nr:hypothetical protein [Gammaproteobacteria bacterium]
MAIEQFHTLLSSALEGKREALLLLAKHAIDKALSDDEIAQIIVATEAQFNSHDDTLCNVLSSEIV